MQSSWMMIMVVGCEDLPQHPANSVKVSFAAERRHQRPVWALHRDPAVGRTSHSEHSESPGLCCLLVCLLDAYSRLTLLIGCLQSGASLYWTPITPHLCHTH